MAKVDGKKFDVSRSSLGIGPDTGDKDKDISNIEQAKRVTKADVTVKKKSGLQKVTETFLGGDIRDVANYVIKDVLISSTSRSHHIIFKVL